MDSTLASLISSADQGDAGAAETLFAMLYRELHRLALREVARAGGGWVALGATTLLHEAYLDMSARGGTTYPDRARFMSYASKVMRGLIIDHVRNRRAQKRGGLFVITGLDGDQAEAPGHLEELTRLSDALEELGKVDPALATVVDLKFFCGLSFVEIAAMRGVSERTVQRQWEQARIYLHHTLKDEITS